ncbi:UNVERIFIED_CONTAM: Pre-splicing factor ISY1 [Sesamum radiatum]|uniref:Pre-splicing factor ISY1 n=1 Tax=Sesamum radiatum TaxID=300843 RepID=A0AAW2P4Z8_SESRA
MARNEEKAQSMLNRFIAMKSEEKKKPKERRPYLASECRDLAEADKWRQQIMREIGRKVAEIQNEGLGEHRLRDLNDEINKLIREKTHWERRIVELGGPNYTKHSAKMTDLDGNIVDVPNPGGRGPGYRYFGAAKKLPGVRELFEKPPELRKRRTRYDIYKRIDASYYGYRDDEDGILEKLEGPAEQKMRAAALADWMEMEKIKKEARRAVKSGEVAEVGVASKILFEEEEDVVEEERRKEREKEEKEKEKEFVAHVPLPDEEEIKKKPIAHLDDFRLKHKMMFSRPPFCVSTWLLECLEAAGWVAQLLHVILMRHSMTARIEEYDNVDLILAGCEDGVPQTWHARVAATKNVLAPVNQCKFSVCNGTHGSLIMDVVVITNL